MALRSCPSPEEKRFGKKPQDLENPFISEFDPDYTIQTVIHTSHYYEKNILR